jgi:glycosyltransferase involved in cell wall biosynthesis
MNILMIVANPYSHDPRVKSEAEALVKAGHTVHVLGWDRHGTFPRSEEINGVLVHRIGRTLGMKIMPLDILRMRFWWKEAVRREAPFIDKIDVIHCHDLDTLPIGIRLKKLRKIPLIYDAHEIWGYMVSFDIPWWKRYINLEKRLVKEADIMITVDEPLQEYFAEFFGRADEDAKLSSKPIYIIKNCKEFNEVAYQPPTEKIFTMVYAGTLGASREILELMDAVRETDNIKFIIAGSGNKKYVRKVKKHCSQNNNVKYLGRISQEEVIALTKRCHVGVCLLGKGTLSNKMALPNKVFEAMVSGRPLITTKGLYYSDFAHEKGFGIPVGSVDECIEAIKILMADPKKYEQYGVKALEAALEYNWANEKEKLVEIYRSLGKKPL